MFLSKKKIILISMDFVICMLSFISAYIFLKVTDIFIIADYSIWLSCVFLPICMITGMCISQSYNIIFRYANTMDMIKCSAGVLIGLTAFCLGDMVIGYMYVLVFKFVCGMSAGIMMVGIRFIYYIHCSDKRNKSVTKKRKRTLLIGAGMASTTIINEMRLSQYVPVGIVDDDKQKHHRTIGNVKVIGATEDIDKICKEMNIETILFAIPSCDNERRSEILQLCADTGCEVKILPYVREIVEKDNLLFQAKKVSVEDLLGRNPVVFDDEDTRKLIENQVLLVNGGGGSIGSELCRQVAKHNPKKLIILDIYENNAYNIQQELKREYGDKLDFCVEIASVRDYKKMNLIYDRYKPDVVIHAAAHKHVPLMEDNPEEAVKNNVFGTYNCARLADKYKVKTFLLISTDKAVNPTNIMGATKRICEMIVQYMSKKSKTTKYCAVRFGNVLGSNGSVIPLFNSQIEKGGPVTVTHPDIIRYFMTIPEAVSLVLKAASMAKKDEIFILDMGKPVKIVDLARKLIKLNGYIPDVTMKIEFSGLRPGEKLYEELLMLEEGLKKTSNNKIFVGKQIDVNQSEFVRQLNLLNEAARENNIPKIISLVSEMVPTYNPNYTIEDLNEENVVEDIVEDVVDEQKNYDNKEVALATG